MSRSRSTIGPTHLRRKPGGKCPAMATRGPYSYAGLTDHHRDNGASGAGVAPPGDTPMTKYPLRISPGRILASAVLVGLALPALF